MESREALRDAYAKMMGAEAERLEAAGVVLAGHAYGDVALVKTRATEAELNGAALLSGPDGSAIKASLKALGYGEDDWVGMLFRQNTPAESLPLLSYAFSTFTPHTVLLMDEGAAMMARNLYADELADLEDLNEAFLAPGYVAHVAGMRLLNLGGVDEKLADQRSKQLLWSWLKKLPPLGAPY